MLIILAHSNQVAKWEGSWLFLGQDFIRMREWEKRLPGERISLRERMLHQSSELRHPFLVWLENQRILRKDSLVWWMTQLAGRNNASSPLYVHLCQITALQEFLHQKAPKFPEKLLVVCEDSFLFLAVQHILEKQNQCKRARGWMKAFAWEWTRLSASVGVSWLREFIRSLRTWWSAWRTRPYNQVIMKESKKNLVLFHRCLDDNAIQPQGIRDRFLTELPDFLKKKEFEVVTLPWLWNIQKSLSEVFRDLRRESVIVVEDHLKLLDYFWAFWQQLQTAMLWRGKQIFQEMEITPLLWRENIDNARSGPFRFWLYQPALRRWAENFHGIETRKLFLIQQFEGMPPEHVQVATLRKKINNLKVIGYYHVLTTREFLPYHFMSSEWESRIMPDVIVTNGTLGRQTLVKQGAPPDRMKIGPALRQDYRALNCNYDEDRNNLLLLLPIDLKPSIELITLLSNINPTLQKKYGSPVQIKPHPMASPKFLLERSGLKEMPENWTWAEGEIQESLINAHCCVTSMSSAVYDAVLAGCITMSVQLELELMCNYFDILEDEYPSLQAVIPDKLWERLDAVFGEEQETFRAEFAKVRRKLIQGMTQPSDETLSVFIS